MGQFDSNELRKAIERQAAFIKAWERPSQATLLETVRAIDATYCQELFLGELEPESNLRMEMVIESQGVNHALRMVFPPELSIEEFKFFESRKPHSDQAKNLLFHCGCLQIAENIARPDLWK